VAKKNRPPPAECPCCGQLIARRWRILKSGARFMKFRDHNAPCGLPCKTKQEAALNERFHEIAEECDLCRANTSVDVSRTPFGPKPPWQRLVITPHSLKSCSHKTGLNSVVAAAELIERLYPQAKYTGSQKKAKGTSHTKRTMKGKARKRSQRVDLYQVKEGDDLFTFYVKRNVLMTVHVNDR